MIGSQIIHLKTTNSTNDEAHLLAENNALNGTMVVAETQTQGRGRRGASWFSPKGGVYTSIILRPQEVKIDIAVFEKFATIATYETVGSFCSKQMVIKPPNDILIQGRKVAGILVESRYSGMVINYIIIGIGINVSSDFFKFPEILQDSAITINKLQDNKITTKEVFNKLIYTLNKWNNILITEGYMSIIKKWDSIII